MFIFSLVFLLFMGLEVYLLYKIIANKNNIDTIDTTKYSRVLVLGANVYSNTFLDRINTLKQIKKINPLIKIMFSGTQNEAQAFLKLKFENVIHIDNTAKNTKDNISNLVSLITSDTLIITNCFHQFRVKLILNDNHLHAKVVSSDQKVYYISIIREILAIHKHFFNNIFKIS